MGKRQALLMVFFTAIFLLASSLTSVVKTPIVSAHDPNNKPIFVDLYDNEISEDSPPLSIDFSIQVHAYISSSSGMLIMPTPIIARDNDDGDTVTITTSELPSGLDIIDSEEEPAWVTDDAEVKVLAGSLPSDITNIPTEMYPISFAVTFYATDNHGLVNELPVLVIVYWNQLPVPTIEFDEPSYFLGEKVNVTIIDPLADTDGIAYAEVAAKDTIIFTVEYAGASIEVSATEVDISDNQLVRPGTFRGYFEPQNFELGGPGAYRVSYPGATDGSVIIHPIGVRLDKSKYGIGDRVIITYYQQGSTEENIPVGLGTATQNIPNLVLQRQGSIQGLYSRAITIVNGPGPAGPDEIRTNPSDTITVWRGGYEDHAPVEDVSVSFDRPFYTQYDMATVSITDFRANKNSTKSEVVSATVASSEPIEVTLLETEVDSGVFSSINYVGFLASSTQPSNDAAELLPVSPIDDTDTPLTVTYVSDPGSPVTSVTRTGAAIVHTDLLSGIGSSTGQPIPATEIVDISNIACGSFGGDSGDRDGVCNAWEGPSYNGGVRVYYDKYYLFTSANSGSEYCDPVCSHSSNKDIFVELDTLEAGGSPESTVMETIQDYFSDNGYKFHYVVNELDIPIDGTGNLLNVWKDPPAGDGSTYDSYWEVKKDHFGKPSLDGGSYRDKLYKADGVTLNTRGAAKKQIFHYGLFSNEAQMKWDSGAVTASGYSEFVGNDFIVTLGYWADDRNKDLGTLMHELGHNLGLHHGGGPTSHVDSPTPSVVWIDTYLANCNPLYKSSMSYSRQWPNAVTATNLSWWDASYSNDTLTDPLSIDMDILNEANGPDPTVNVNRDIEIAWGGPDGSDPDLKRDILRDIRYDGAAGTQQYVNWDGDLTENENPVNQQIVNLDIQGCDLNNYNNNVPADKIIEGFDDWDNLVLDFRLHASTNFENPGVTGTFGAGAGMTISPLHEDVNATISNAFLVAGVGSISSDLHRLNTTYYAMGHNASEFDEKLVADEEDDDKGDVIVSLSRLGFRPGGEVKISGKVRDLIPSQDALIVVTDPTGRSILVDSVEVDHRKKFLYSFTLGNNSVHGTYDVDVTYGNEDGSDAFEVASDEEDKSVVAYIKNGEYIEAVNALIKIRESFDGGVGGNPSNDVITEPVSRDRMLARIDANIQVLAAEPLENWFRLTMASEGKYYIIVGESSTVNDNNPVHHTFTINHENGNNTITGILLRANQDPTDITLRLQSGLVRQGQELTSQNTEVRINGTAIAFMIDDSEDSSFWASSLNFTIPGANTAVAEETVYSVEISDRHTVIAPEFPSIPVVLLTIAIVIMIIMTRSLNRFRSSGPSFLGLK